MVLHKRMLALWPILQGSLFRIVLDKHMLTQWPSFLEIIILHCTVQVLLAWWPRYPVTPSWETIHWIVGGSLQLPIGKPVAVFVSSGLQLPLGKPSAVQVSGDGQQFIMSCPGCVADQM